MSAPHEETKTELVIDRKRWLRGEGSAPSRLLRPEDGKMCCLGFYGLACGLSADQIRGVGAPYRVNRYLWPPWMLDDYGDDGMHGDVWELMRLNDHGHTESRESRIAAVFARHGVTVRFADEPETQP